MRTTDLQIGDWVNSYDAQAYKVTSIHINNKGCAVRLEFDEYIVETWADKIEPIPLTEEILKANGFFLNNNWFYKRVRENGVFDVSVSIVYREIEITKVCGAGTEDEEADYGVDIPFGYENIHVHKFQHALRLCGLNGLADNFKICPKK